MGSPTVNDFVVSSKGYCFICLNSQADSLISRNTTTTISSHSLQYLSHYLKMDRKKVFNPRRGPVPPDLLEKVKRSRLKVELCLECAFLNNRFAELYSQLEKLRMEVGSCLSDIQAKLLKADRAGTTEQFLKLADSGVNGHQVEVVGVLRTEAMEKCSKKLTTNLPRIRIPAPGANKSKSKYSKSAASRKGKQNVPIRRQRISKAYHPDNHQPPQRGKSGDLTIIYPANNNVDRSGMKSKWSFNPLTGKRRCGLCPYECNTGAAFHIHFNKDHLKARFKCNLCGKQFPYRASYHTHYQTSHAGVKYKCRFCSKAFTTKAYMLKHQQQFCVPSGPGHMIDSTAEGLVTKSVKPKFGKRGRGRPKKERKPPTTIDLGVRTQQFGLIKRRPGRPRKVKIPEEIITGSPEPSFLDEGGDDDADAIAILNTAATTKFNFGQVKMETIHLHPGMTLAATDEEEEEEEDFDPSAFCAPVMNN